MNNTKDILEKEKREATIKDGIDPVRVGWNSAIDHLIPIVEKLVERAKQEGRDEEEFDKRYAIHDAESKLQ